MPTGQSDGGLFSVETSSQMTLACGELTVNSSLPGLALPELGMGVHAVISMIASLGGWRQENSISNARLGYIESVSKKEVRKAGFIQSTSYV